MKVYITQANSMQIMRKLDKKNLNIQGSIYNIPIYFFSQREEQSLLAYKELMKNPEKFIDEIYQKINIEDNYTFVFEGKNPCFHHRENCERLLSEYRNYLIPEEIKEKGIKYIQRFRNWFKDNHYLLEENKEDIFEMRIHAAFGIRLKIKEIVKDNSGVKTIENYNLSQLEKEINLLIKEAGRYYYQSTKNTKILKQYSKYSFLSNKNEPLYNNKTGYSDEEVKSFLSDYETRYKRPLINLLYNYYRVKFNPDLKMEGYLLEQLGFRACKHCCI